MRLGFTASILALAALLHAGPARAVAPSPRVERTTPAAVAEPAIARVAPRAVFEQNRGQAGPGPAFVVRHAAFTAFLEPHAATFATGDAEPVRMAFRAAAPGCRIVGSGPTGGVTSSFRGGRDAIRAPHFAGATTPALRPGVDLRWRTDEEGRLTYDLVVAPGADPAAVEFDVAGACDVRVAADGSLRIETSAGEMTHTRPFVYQESEHGRVRVAGEFAVRGESVVGFQVGAYDRTRTLVIDPSIDYAVRVGGGGTFGRAIAVDFAHAAYVAGRTRSSTFPATSGPGDANGDDVFVTKIAPDGRSVVWSVLLGGSHVEDAFAISVNSQGQAVVGGETQSADFPLAGSLVQREVNGSFGFVTKFAADGASLLYSTLVGLPDRPSRVSGLTLDPQGRAVAVGSIWDGAAFATDGAYVAPGAGGHDVLIAKLAADGSALEWGALLGGDGADHASGVALGADGAVYVCGSTQLGTFPVTTDLFKGAGDGAEMFLAKLSPDGTSLAYCVEFATTSEDRAHAVAVDADGGAYLTGESQPYSPGRRTRSVLPVTGRPVGSTTTSPRGSPFALKVNPAGDALEWSVRVGGRWGTGYAIATDDSGGVVVAGTVGRRVGPSTALHRYGRLGGTDCFVTRISRQAKSVTYTAILGGDEHDSAEGLALGSDGRAYVTGTTVGGRPPFDRVLAGSSLEEGAGVVRFAPHNVRLVMQTGMVEAGPGGADWYVVTGTHGFANVVPDFDPRTRDLVIRFRYGERVDSKLLQYNPSRWVRSATGVYFYDARADHSLKVWFTAKSFRILVSKLDLRQPLTNPFALEIRFGEDRGYDQRVWRRTQTGPRERYQLGD
jgi:hypothetical protein